MSTRPDPAGPTRTCVGCRERAAKRELLRVTLGADDDGPAVVPDPRGVAPGRGAHVHHDLSCVAMAERRRAFRRALRYDGAAVLSTQALRDQVAQHAPTQVTERKRSISS